MGGLKADASEAAAAAESLVVPAQPSTRGVLESLPDVDKRVEFWDRYAKVVEQVYALDDPAAEFAAIVSALRIEDALTPGRLQEALNDAEDVARRAHRLYVCAKADFDSWELEHEQLLGRMRDGATTELQVEKEQGRRNKAITDADVRARAAQMYPEDWAAANERRGRADGMLDHIKRVASLWEARCYSIAAMLQAGRRKI